MLTVWGTHGFLKNKSGLARYSCEACECMWVAWWFTPSTSLCIKEMWLLEITEDRINGIAAEGQEADESSFWNHDEVTCYPEMKEVHSCLASTSFSFSFSFSSSSGSLLWWGKKWFQVGETGAGYKWSIRDGGQEEEWRHSVAPIPPEKIQEIMAAEEEGEIEEADNDVGVGATDNLAGAGEHRNTRKTSLTCK